MAEDEERPVLPWRLVVGILLHFAIPAYLLFLLIAFLISPGTAMPAEARVRWLLRESGMFVGGFVLATFAAGFVSALIDLVLRRLRLRTQARDPDRSAIASRQRSRKALARIAAADWGKAHAHVAAAVERLGRDPWDHCDASGQRLSMDLMEAANAFVPALDSARGAKRAELADLAAAALGRIADALEQQAADKSRLDEGDARTIARMIDLRYGDNDRPVSLDPPKERE